MRLFDKRTPLQKEWEKLEVQEQRFLQKRSEKRESILNQKLEEKIPPKLQKTLDTAFAKAFALIFEKGTGVIEKTYQRTKLEQDYQVRQYMADVKQNSKSLRSFSKKARDTGTKNLLLSGASGIGMGVLGIGLPDIPVFTGMILRNIYETALQYGFSYESREEKYFILLLIQGAVSSGETLCEMDGKLNEFIRSALQLVGSTEMKCLVLDTDDEWMKVRFTDKKNNQITKLLRIENIDEIEIVSMELK